MSHFSVAVFSDGKKTLEELLAPYDEKIVIEPYIKESKERAIERVREEIITYANDGPYAEWKKDPQKYESKCHNQGHINYLKNKFPKKLSFSDEDCYKEAIEFLEPEELDEDGNILSTYNPKSKWDWWQIGGRWKGMLRAKSGFHGEASAVEPILDKEGYFDSAFIKDIDFTPDEKKYQMALRFWEVYIEKAELLPGENERNFNGFWKESYYIERYQDKETYAKIESSFETYAVITPDGVWHEKGEMGWFGMSSETSDESLDWDLHFKERFIDTANQEWILTVVDCHI